MFDNHRVWKFIETSKKNNKNSMLFYYPVGKCAKLRYDKLQEDLRSKGYIVSILTPEDVERTRLMCVSNILGVNNV